MWKYLDQHYRGLSLGLIAPTMAALRDLAPRAVAGAPIARQLVADILRNLPERHRRIWVKIKRNALLIEQE